MNSRESIYTHAGVTDPSPDFESLDGTGVRCGEINQKAIDWANKHAGEHTSQRFDAHGQKYVIGADIDVCPAGNPCLNILNYHTVPFCFCLINPRSFLPPL